MTCNGVHVLVYNVLKIAVSQLLKAWLLGTKAPISPELNGLSAPTFWTSMGRGYPVKSGGNLTYYTAFSHDPYKNWICCVRCGKVEGFISQGTVGSSGSLYYQVCFLWVVCATE
jgi:hypothetical protein